MPTPEADLLNVVIPRHCVAKTANGLSPLQERLLASPSPIRIASAPTGTGKSFAFQYAVTEGKKRVLFIVPTRRLAQNLAHSLIEQIAGSTDVVALAAAAKRIVLWTSDQREIDKETYAEIGIGRLRVRQINGYILPEDSGDMLIATPESVAYMMIAPSKGAMGQNPVGPFTLVQQFDHIVFDEFHTIDARGFGLAATICAFAALGRAGDAKVTFLSATPINIVPVLTALDIDLSQIEMMEEAIVTGCAAETGNARAVHGDVTISFDRGEDADLVSIALRSRELILFCLARGRQLVFIFDSLDKLTKAKSALAMFLASLGLTPDQCLAISSIDDSAQGIDAGFTYGRQHNPMDFKVLLATSSIEMGVTFRAGLIIMDPGHDALSLVQRIGRVARGDEEGQIIISCNKAETSRKDWLRSLFNRLTDMLAKERSPTPNIEVKIFIRMLLEANIGKFDLPKGADEEAEPKTFRTMAHRAVWCSALFWAALYFSKAQHLGQQRNLDEGRPKKADSIIGLLKGLKRIEMKSTRDWVQAFLQEALSLRSLEPRVLVRYNSGIQSIPWNMYTRYPALFRAPAAFDKNDQLTIDIDRPLTQIVHGQSVPSSQANISALLPHERETLLLARNSAADEWIKRVKKRLSNGLPGELEEILDRALKLVQMTRIVPKAESLQAGPQSSVIL